MVTKTIPLGNFSKCVSVTVGHIWSQGTAPASILVSVLLETRLVSLRLHHLPKASYS